MGKGKEIREMEEKYGLRKRLVSEEEEVNQEWAQPTDRGLIM